MTVSLFNPSQNRHLISVTVYATYNAVLLVALSHSEPHDGKLRYIQWLLFSITVLVVLSYCCYYRSLSKLKLETV